MIEHGSNYPSSLRMTEVRLKSLQSHGNDNTTGEYVQSLDSLQLCNA